MSSGLRPPLYFAAQGTPSARSLFRALVDQRYTGSVAWARALKNSALNYNAGLREPGATIAPSMR
jgi:hypothetical protein